MALWRFVMTQETLKVAAEIPSAEYYSIVAASHYDLEKLGGIVPDDGLGIGSEKDSSIICPPGVHHAGAQVDAFCLHG